MDLTLTVSPCGKDYDDRPRLTDGVQARHAQGGPHGCVSSKPSLHPWPSGCGPALTPSRRASSGAGGGSSVSPAPAPSSKAAQGAGKQDRRASRRENTSHTSVTHPDQAGSLTSRLINSCLSHLVHGLRRLFPHLLAPGSGALPPEPGFHAQLPGPLGRFRESPRPEG